MMMGSVRHRRRGNGGGWPVPAGDDDTNALIEAIFRHIGDRLGAIYQERETEHRRGQEREREAREVGRSGQLGRLTDAQKADVLDSENQADKIAHYERMNREREGYNLPWIQGETQAEHQAREQQAEAVKQAKVEKRRAWGATRMQPTSAHGGRGYGVTIEAGPNGPRYRTSTYAAGRGWQKGGSAATAEQAGEAASRTTGLKRPTGPAEYPEPLDLRSEQQKRLAGQLEYRDRQAASRGAMANPMNAKPQALADAQRELARINGQYGLAPGPYEADLAGQERDLRRLNELNAAPGQLAAARERLAEAPELPAESAGAPPAYETEANPAIREVLRRAAGLAAGLMAGRQGPLW